MRIFGFNITRRSIENPRVPISQIDLDGYGAGTAAGESVTERSALALTAVYAAIRLISETTATLPIHLIRERGGRRERVYSDPVGDLLRVSPNDEMTASTFVETVLANAVASGTGIAYIYRHEKSKKPLQLYPVPYYLVRPERVKNEAGQFEKRYLLTLDGKTFSANDADVLHLPGFSYDGITGYSPIALMRESIGVSLAAQKYGAKFFGGGGRPRGVIELSGHLKSETFEEFKQRWRAAYGSADSNDTAILEHGAKYSPISIPPEDAQFLQTRQFGVLDVARMFRVPPHMLGDLTKASYSSIEQQNIDLVTYTLRPWLVKFEQELNRKLLSANSGHYFRFAVEGLLRGDIASRYASYAIGRQWGWLSVNDILELEDRNPVENGNDYLVPMNMIPAEQVAKQKQEQDARMSYLMRAHAQRLAKKEAQFIDRYAGKPNFDERASEFWNLHAAHLSSDLLISESVLTSQRELFLLAAKNPDKFEETRLQQLFEAAKNA
jgi:HK97 family phage portal protein